MKQLHRPEMFCWSAFDETRNVDFHSVLWVHEDGNVLVDPLPLSDHDRRHLDTLGGAKTIVITNSDHTRDSERIAEAFGARLFGPRTETKALPEQCEPLGDGDEPVRGLRVLELHGSKTPGELALLVEATTLITGDLIRAHSGGTLHLLPDAKLDDKTKAAESVHRLAQMTDIEAVLVGDGWPVFRSGHALLGELDRRLSQP